MMTITTLYKSREDRVAELADDSVRLQYDDALEDEDRITHARYDLEGTMADLDAAVDDYLDANFELEDNPTDPDNYSGLALARADIIEKWVDAQRALSHFAYVFRINGNEAFNRGIDALKNEEPVNFRDL